MHINCTWLTFAVMWNLSGSWDGKIIEGIGIEKKEIIKGIEFNQKKLQGIGAGIGFN